MSFRSVIVQRTPRRVLVAVDRHPQLKRILRRGASRSVPKGIQDVVLPSGPCRGAHMTLDFTYTERYLWLGTYEPWVAATLPKVLSEGDTMWDIGANIGYYLLFAARLSSAQHLGVEADPGNMPRLAKHLGDNQVDAEVLEVAVASSPGTLRMDTHEASMLSKLSDTGEIEVPAVTLDSLLDGRKAPTVVMMDIEGAEADALAGAHHLLHDVRPSWLVELHGDPGLVAHGMLVDAGYEIRRADQKTPIEKQLTSHRTHILATPK